MAGVAVAETSTKRKRPTIIEIQRAVARRSGVPRKYVLSPSRLAGLVRPRHVGMYLAHLAHYSYPRIARGYKLKDHTTALHAKRKIVRLLEQAKDHDLMADVEALKKELGLEPEDEGPLQSFSLI